GLSGPNPNGLPSIFDHFNKAGYTTSAVGKIHCPEYWIEDAVDNFHETCGCSIGGRSQKYTEFLKDRGKLDLEDHGSLTEFGQRGNQSMEGRPSPLTYEESQEGWIAAETIQFMKEAAGRDKPFLAFASLPRPHQCTSPSAPFWELYEGKDLCLPPNADSDLTDKAPHMRQAAERWRRGEWTLFEPKTFEAGRMRKLRGYLGAVSQVDHAVGQMVGFLDRNSLKEDTIVIYTSDHGDYATEHGIMEKAPGICADAITRIPFIWRWPGQVSENRVADEMVEAIDLSTTICRLAGLDPLETSDGKDISHLLNGGDGEVRRIAVTEFAWSKSVRKGKHRLVFYPPEMFEEEHPEGFGELYDLESDPWEMENLYFEKEYAETIREMERALLDWMVTSTRPATALGVNIPKTSQTADRYRNTVNADNRFHPDI
ncbi:MAG: sulfatase-like hydrolase/transferase, partial [Planctomycetota bacterium]|nr:sulfatase-like hydrolase/transferase [Planctomycetota bacterium]